MSLALLLLAVAAGAGSSDIPDGHAPFARMSDLEIDNWMRSTAFYHSVNVYRCRGYSERAAERRISQVLGRNYDARHAAISHALRGRYGNAYSEESEFLGFGYLATPSYCRRIRFVAQDLLRGTAELERRLGLVH